MCLHDIGYFSISSLLSACMIDIRTRGDDRDNDGDSSRDDDDDEDEEDEEEEEDEHLDLADAAVVVPTVEPVSPPEGTE
nr:hypothetical protein [Tanacetum cinerariifolium]